MSPPTRVVRHGNEQIDIWEIDSKYHRLDAPAFVSYRKDGTVKNDSWWINGQRHRVLFPAVTRYDKIGNPIEYKYFNYNQNITDEVSEYLQEHEITNPLDISLEHQIIMKMKFW